MSISLDVEQIAQQIAETHQQCFQLIERHRPLAANALQGLEDLRPFDEPAGQRAIERRQPQAPILEHLDEYAAGAEQNHRPELRIDRAADDQFIALRARPSAAR